MDEDKCKGELTKHNFRGGDFRRARRPSSGKTEEPSPSEIPQLCCLCSEDIVIGVCSECEEYMCTRCIKIHMKGKATRNHKIVEVTPEIPTSAEAEENELTHIKCRFHGNFDISEICVDCKKLLCSRCYHDSHPCHNVIQLENSKRTLQVMCFDAVEVLNGCKEDLEKIRKHAGEGKQDLVLVCESAKIELASRRDELVKEIDNVLENCNVAIDEYNKMTNDKYKEIDEYAESYINTVVNKLDDINSVPASHNIHTMVNALTNFHIDAAPLYRDCTKCMSKLKRIAKKNTVQFTEDKLEKFQNLVCEVLAFSVEGMVAEPCSDKVMLKPPKDHARLSSSATSLSSSGIGSAFNSVGSDDYIKT